MSVGYPLGAEQGLEPAEDEEDEETPVNSDEQGRGFGDVGSSLHDTFGQKSTFTLRPPPLQHGQFGSSGVSFGGSGVAQHDPVAPPGESAHAQFLNQHAHDANAQLRGRYASQNGRSQNDVARNFGTPQGQQ